jgi:hypothetical protein
MASKKRSLAESVAGGASVVTVDTANTQAPPAESKEPDLKKKRGADEIPPPPPPPDAPAPPPPPPPVQEIVRSAHIIYPDQYGLFDPQKIAFPAAAQPAREGGGQILFMSYVYPDGQTRPLLLHTPRGMHSPQGVKLWKDGKSSALLSLGRDCGADPLMSRFRHICDAIQLRAAQVALEKRWMDVSDLETTKNQFSPLVFVGSDSKTGESYPPSIKAIVVVSGKDKSEFFQYSTTPPLKSLIPGDLEGNCSMTAVLHVAWIFAKKTKKGPEFSIRCTLFQGIIETSGGTADQRNGCAVLI